MLRSMTPNVAPRLALAIVLSLGLVGCETLSPDNLWKMNRQPNMDGGDAYFSIPAEIDQAAATGDHVTTLEAPAPRT